VYGKKGKKKGAMGGMLIGKRKNGGIKEID